MRQTFCGKGCFCCCGSSRFALFLVPFWLIARSRAAEARDCQSRLARSFQPSVPRRTFWRRLREERAAGRKLILATGTPRSFAEAIAKHLGLFDTVIATDGLHNLTSGRKADALIAAYGDGGFDYAGNSRHDLRVSTPPALRSLSRRTVTPGAGRPNMAANSCRPRKPTLRTIAKMLRVHQWLKNGLIAVPMVLSHEYLNVSMLSACVLAFISFSTAASAIYIVNDFFDLALDRRHPTKRNRPLASGLVSVPFRHGGDRDPAADQLCRRVASADRVFRRSGRLSDRDDCLFLLREAHAAARRLDAGRALHDPSFGRHGGNGVDASFWLLAFSSFFFLSLALVKRFVELRSSPLTVGERIAGRGYRAEDQEIIAQAGMASAFAVGACSGALHRQRRGAHAIRASVDGLAAGSDRALHGDAGVDPGAPRRVAR